MTALLAIVTVAIAAVVAVLVIRITSWLVDRLPDHGGGPTI